MRTRTFSCSSRILQLENDDAVVGDTGDLADHATTGDDLVTLAELREHRLRLALALHLRADQQEIENPEDHQHHHHRLQRLHGL
jgi:hypothetical protein